MAKIINKRMKFPKTYKSKEGKYGTTKEEKMAKKNAKYKVGDNVAITDGECAGHIGIVKNVTYSKTLDHYSYEIEGACKEDIGEGNLLASSVKWVDKVVETEKNKAPLDTIEIQNAELKDNAYIPQSDNCNSVDTVTPNSMRYDMHKAIETIDRRVNGVDEYVAEKLGYVTMSATPDERKEGIKGLCDAFSAEQVDAIAVAIYNIEEKNQGCIIGDQTGIGKGRIAAGMIMYAIKRGLKPIFITEKPNLFSDLFRDIIAIGGDSDIPLEILKGNKMVEKRQ